MFTVGWRSGRYCTQLARRCFNLKMGNCADKTMASTSKPVVKEVKLVCKDDELKEGELKEVQLSENLSCLVAKQNGKVYAVGNKCSHYGANLVNGSLGNGVITCPWHGACFNLANGDIEDFPGLDSLPKYDVSVEEGQVKVHFSPSSETKRIKSMSKRDPKNSQVVVVVGGGAAAQSCVETLRNRDNPFTGRIILLTAEETRPYDRIKLSKALGSTAEELALRPTEFYKKSDIEIMTSSEVIDVDTQTKEVKIKSGTSLKFTYLVLATGGKPRTLPLPGSDASNIFVLRSPKDANQILSLSENKNVVIIGTSFIGMEVAASLVGKASSVTVVGNGAVPFGALGDEIGKFVQAMHEEKGVHFKLNSKPEEFLKNDDGHLTHVVVNGEQIEADVCVLGVGVEPSTGFLAGTDVSLDQRGSVVVNEFLETNVEGVFAAGDIAAFPLDLPTLEPGTLAAIGHWQLALAHGKCVGENVAAKKKSALHTVPFFWTVQFGKSIRYAGYGSGFDDILYDGEVSSGKFAAYYCKGDEVIAVATLMKDPIAAHFANRLRDGHVLNKAEALTEWYK